MHSNTTTVIIGPTGSGKTTLVKKILKENGFDSAVYFDHDSTYEQLKQELTNTDPRVYVFDEVKFNKDNLLKNGIAHKLEYLTSIIALRHVDGIALNALKNLSQLIILGDDHMRDIRTDMYLTNTELSSITEEYYNNKPLYRIRMDKKPNEIKDKYKEHVDNVRKTKAASKLFERMIVDECIIYVKDKVKLACVKNNIHYLRGLNDLTTDEKYLLDSIN